MSCDLLMAMQLSVIRGRLGATLPRQQLLKRRWHYTADTKWKKFRARMPAQSTSVKHPTVCRKSFVSLKPRARNRSALSPAFPEQEKLSLVSMLRQRTLTRTVRYIASSFLVMGHLLISCEKHWQETKYVVKRKGY